MVFEFLQAAAHKSHKHSSLFRHLGPFGLLLLAVLDGSPVPTFGGPDILTAVLAATHRTPWYECAAMATVGSAFGAYLTFRMARHAGSAYLNSKFGNGKLPGLLKLFQRWGMGALAVLRRSLPFSHVRIFRRCRSLALPHAQVSRGRYPLPGRAVYAHCPAGGPLWTALPTPSPPSRTLPGLVVVGSRRGRRFDRRRRRCQPETGIPSR